MNEALIARYKLAGDFSDSLGNYGNATNSGTRWTTDKDGNYNGAAEFTVPNYISIPVDTINGLVDYTITLWAKTVSLNFNNSIFSLSNSNAQGYIHTYLSQRYMATSTAKNLW